MDGQGFETWQDCEFPPQKRPNRLWRQYSFLFGGFGGFSLEYSGRVVN